MHRPKSFEDARVFDDGVLPQERNRLWWERLPMTYAEWSHEDRDANSLGTFDEATRLFRSGWVDENVDFSAYAGKGVLEIGCGAGVATSLFAAAGSRVTAVDITEQAIRLTERHIALRDLQGVRVMQMDAEQLAFEPNSFDHVFSWGVIHHSAHSERIIENMARVLKPGGTGLIMVYNRASVRYWIRGAIELLTGFKFLRGETFESAQRFYTDGYFHRHFGPRELAAIIEAYGLVVTNTDVTHMDKKMLPLIPRWLDDIVKRRWGWLLVVRFRQPADVEKGR